MPMKKLDTDKYAKDLVSKMPTWQPDVEVTKEDTCTNEESSEQRTENGFAAEGDFSVMEGDSCRKVLGEQTEKSDTEEQSISATKEDTCTNESSEQRTENVFAAEGDFSDTSLRKPQIDIVLNNPTSYNSPVIAGSSSNTHITYDGGPVLDETVQWNLGGNQSQPGETDELKSDTKNNTALAYRMLMAWWDEQPYGKKKWLIYALIQTSRRDIIRMVQAWTILDEIETTLRKVARSLGQVYWRQLALKLNFSPAEINGFQTKNENPEEQANHMLVTWWDFVADDDKWGRLKGALIQMDRRDISRYTKAGSTLDRSSLWNIARSIGPNWQLLAGTLHFTPAEIDGFERDGENNTEDQTFQMLNTMEWSRRARSPDKNSKQDQSFIVMYNPTFNNSPINAGHSHGSQVNYHIPVKLHGQEDRTETVQSHAMFHRFSREADSDTTSMPSVANVLRDVPATLHSTETGCVKLNLLVYSQEGLEKLWQMYRSGELMRRLKEDLPLDRVNIEEKDYLTGQSFFEERQRGKDTSTNEPGDRLGKTDATAGDVSDAILMQNCPTTVVNGRQIIVGPLPKLYGKEDETQTVQKAADAENVSLTSLVDEKAFQPTSSSFFGWDCVKLNLRVDSLEALLNLWQLYNNGELEERLKEDLPLDRVNIEEKDYLAGLSFFEERQRGKAGSTSDETFLRYVGGKLSTDWKQLAVSLHFTSAEIDEFERDAENNPEEEAFKMLVSWWENQADDKWEWLKSALVQTGRRDLAAKMAGPQFASAESLVKLNTKSSELNPDVRQATRQHLETAVSDQAQSVAEGAKRALKTRYKTTGSYVQMLPWVDDDKMHIMDIYTKLTLVEQVDKVGKGHIAKKQMESYEDIFHFKTRNGDPIKRVVISGLAGVGKTTLVDKIAYDWAMGKSETLREYELVFVLKMRSLKHSSDFKTMDTIFDQLLDSEVDKSVLEKFVNENQNKVLIFLDGFDEIQTTTHNESSLGSVLRVLNQKQGTECCVVTTCCSPLDKYVSSYVEKPFTHVNIEGFADKDIKEFVNKYFIEDVDKAGKCIEKIKLSNILSDLARTPMLLLLMCLIWREESTLPSTMTRLYSAALKYIFRRKGKDIGEDAMSRILISSGKVALDSLFSTDRSFFFREEDFEKSALDAAMTAGVLIVQKVFCGLRSYQSVSFLHFLFFEYCAAKYWQSLIKTGEFNRILGHMISTTIKTHSSRYEYLFRFCCGDNEACTDLILQKLYQCKPMDRRLIVICYFESQSNEQPSEHFIISVLTSSIHLYEWNRDSIKAFIYCLRRVTENTVGIANLAKIKTLLITRCDLNQNVSEDLAESIKLMADLQCLELCGCSITTVNTKQILSSVASLSTLTQLNLSENEALGGSLSLLAPYLTRMESLQALRLDRCSLIAQDVSPVALSLAGMPSLVDLDMSSNHALGGCASLWAHHLKLMKSPLELKLASCALAHGDIGPITESVADMPSLVDLDLSSNHVLGICALLWAPYLKRLKRLKKLTLASCALAHGDIGPIAESVADMPSLVDLDLSSNHALGGCASLWAPYLKLMKRLKKLTLASCALTRGDIGPIAESVADMPSLVDLDLSSNHALGGSASLWAPHLKQMTQHLNKLRLQNCSLTDEDMHYIDVIHRCN